MNHRDFNFAFGTLPLLSARNAARAASSSPGGLDA